MKHLLRIFFVLALLCGGSSSSIARASGIDFRMTVLDPPNSCTPDDTACFIFNAGVPFNVSLSQSVCDQFGLGNGVTPGTYGCFLANNATPGTIDSLELSFLGAPLGNQPASCDSGGQNGTPSALNVVSCTETNGLYDLSFAGGTGIAPGSDLIVFEEGADPTLFQGGSGVVGITPEPDSLMLFSTGVMMAGLYMSRRIWTTVKGSAAGNR
ncbi:hypothetical protein [Tunturiibacter gelidoferens]|uniref:PEP-CTERM sorting domain-containing protein n=2 Tax=Tunturiibacter TaxID=3154218 RepID=A0A7Y9NKD8_9BACT|nr:hypothetical protein [Edaphobacter lichenicola]NYF50438.1 hypothetical protein [Edaphobacter lichenicola]